MNELLAKLPSFALPFVTRSLRGGRGKRYLLFSALLVAATLLVGFGLAFGTGQFEREIRSDLGLEEDLSSREDREFVVYSDDKDALMDDLRVAEQLRREGPGTDWGIYSAVREVHGHGQRLLEDAARSDDATTLEHIELRDRARALVGYDSAFNYHTYFPWHSAEDVALLQRVIELEGIPEVRLYESPLSLRESLALVGFIAGLVLAAAMTVFVPLLVGMQQAQEQHENTLMPLTGTGLRPRELALGLASGPLSVVAIFAAPQLLLFLGCAAVSGEFGIALALLAALAASSLFVTFAAQLLGHLVGPKRTPGIVTLALVTLLTVAWMVGGTMAADLDRDITGFAAVMPTMGLSVLLAETFAELSHTYTRAVLWSTLIWSCAAMIFAWLTLTVLARKIEGRQGSALGTGAALIGAMTCIGLIHVAIPEHPFAREPLRVYFGLAGLLAPFALLLMARVPTAENPPRMRSLPVPRLLLELGLWCVIHIGVSATLFALEPHGLHPVALLWLSWTIGVVGLIAIRMVALPSTLATHVFLGGCCLTVLMGFAQAVFWGFERDHSTSHLFAMYELSPIGGLIQVVITVAVPVVLVRILRKKFASLRTADREPSTPAKTR